MIKIGVLGAGHLGKIHIRLLKQIETVEFVGFYDVSAETRAAVSQEFDIPAFDSAETLIEICDAVDIVVPTTFHYIYADQCLQQGKHIFVEKPVTHTLDEAFALQKLVEEKGLVSQIGHVERFNPAFLSIKDNKIQPLFIESHRLATFNPRGTDVSVIFDLMIHDLDLILSLVNDEVKSVEATGVNIVSNAEDIANARIQFENGCVANVTASRLSLKQMRKMRVFSNDAYISLDFLGKKSEIIRMSDEKTDSLLNFELDTAKGRKYISVETPAVQEVNSIEMELRSFIQSITENAPIEVPLQDGVKALELAHQIADKIKQK